MYDYFEKAMTESFDGQEEEKYSAWLDHINQSGEKNFP